MVAKKVTKKKVTKKKNKGIFIRMHKVLVSESGKRTLHDNRLVKNYPIGYDFDFDIRIAKNWKIFLQKFRYPNGNKLPVKNSHGDRIVYRVDYVAMPQDMKEWFFDRTGALPYSLYHSLFPAYESEYPIRKLRDVTLFGGIEKGVYKK